MSTEQQTPETDAAFIRGQDGIWDLAGVGPIVCADFARTLERQRDALRTEVARLTNALEAIANPRRGLPEEYWNAEQIGNFARETLKGKTHV